MSSNNYVCVFTIEDIKAKLKGCKLIAFDIECSPTEEYRQDQFASLDPHKATITGISFSFSHGAGFYIPLAHKVGKNVDNPSLIIQWLKHNIFENDKIMKIAHNIAYEASFLYKYNISIRGPVYDTICASQLTLKSKWEFRKLSDSGLKTLVPEVFGVDMATFQQVTQGKHFDELNPSHEETVRYACADSDFTLRLYNRIQQWFNDYLPKHKIICANIESPVAVYTGIMKHNGINVDKQLMVSKQHEAEKKLQELTETIYGFAGRKLNIGVNASTKAFKDFLYKYLDLPVFKVTDKLKESVDDEALVLLKQWCRNERPEVVPFIETIQEYRKWSKIKSTYIDGLLKLINSKTGRIHTDFFPLGTDTGRFSSRNPNLQNLPRKDNDPIGVRNFFIPTPGYVFLDFDFSQIELRVGAYYCKDAKMMETYNNNGDIHGITTSAIYQIPLQESLDKTLPQYKERRAIAKNCNFGIFFGLFPKGLQSTLKFKAGIEKSEKQCELIIKNIKKAYPALITWQDEAKRTAALRQYSETALGRRRMLVGINNTDWSIKSYWERCALNTPIQGTAADIIKLTMVRIQKEIWDKPYIRPLLQIHDELLFEVREDKLHEAIDIIKEAMEVTPFNGFNVPIKAEGEFGYSFGSMEPITKGE